MKYDHVDGSPNRIQLSNISVGTAQGLSDIFKLDYDYGAPTSNNDEVMSQTVTLPGGTTLVQSYTYDGVNRLKTAKEMQGTTTLWQQSFIYDAFGNRSMDLPATTAGYVGANPQISSATNRIVPQGAELYNYDYAGNLTHDAAGHQFDYDAENMQVKYDNAVGQYFYDGGEHRVKSIVNGVTTVYVYDVLGQLVAEYSSGAATGGGTSYMTLDALGTPRLVTGTNAANPVKARHDYLPFGEEITNGAGGRTAALGYVADGLRQKYTGKERDQESGLDYFASRYYASTMGRFMSVDSVAGQVGNPQTFNRYAYVLNNPLGLVDPSGHEGVASSADQEEARRALRASMRSSAAANGGGKVSIAGNLGVTGNTVTAAGGGPAFNILAGTVNSDATIDVINTNVDGLSREEIAGGAVALGLGVDEAEGPEPGPAKIIGGICVGVGVAAGLWNMAEDIQDGLTRAIMQR